VLTQYLSSKQDQRFRLKKLLLVRPEAFPLQKKKYRDLIIVNGAIEISNITVVTATWWSERF